LANEAGAFFPTAPAARRLRGLHGGVRDLVGVDVLGVAVAAAVRAPAALGVEIRLDLPCRRVAAEVAAVNPPVPLFADLVVVEQPAPRIGSDAAVPGRVPSSALGHVGLEIGDDAHGHQSPGGLSGPPPPSASC